MTKTSLVGLLILVAGGLVYGFKMLARLMGQAGSRSHITFMEALGGPEHFEWIDSLPAGFLQKWMDGFIHLPLFLILVVLGLVILILNGIFAKK
ncbi:MAG TPA: hypothetical protein VKO20_09450 [Desulfosalsimonadaceae bacterium]|nr:hypothetical protein [Desulfosalsimonadaceae bacterium]